MSLTYFDPPRTAVVPWDGAEQKVHDDMAMLTRYLAILENNKRASRFIPDDVAVALDMAGFVRGRLHGDISGRGHSIARLALALIQPDVNTPWQ